MTQDIANTLYEMDNLEGPRGINSNSNENRFALFDALDQHKEAITEEFEGSFAWNRAPEKQKSSIVFARDGHIRCPDDEIEEIRKWCVTHLLKLKAVFEPRIEQALDTLSPSLERNK